MSDSPILWEERVEPGATWSHVLKRGTALRITDMMAAETSARFSITSSPDRTLQHAGHT